MHTGGKQHFTVLSTEVHVNNGSRYFMPLNHQSNWNIVEGPTTNRILTKWRWNS